jgi:hypothetical protein
MQLHNTILALQVMNGAKVYAVRLMNSDGSYSQKTYDYKGRAVFSPGDHVIVPTHGGRKFAFGKIESDVEDIDYDSEHRLLWINGQIDDPFEVFARNDKRDGIARRKLAATRAQQAAEEHLRALGVNPTAFELECKAEEEADNAKE